MLYRKIKGTRDILPDEALIREQIFSLARNLFETYGYLPILTPTFEQTELFVRGIGEATDIVQKEMYTFTDRAGRSLTLRPEGTAPVVRAYIENRLKEFRNPTKLYYICPMFRYERPQKGRLREFWQIGAEAFGAVGPDIDAEIIELMTRFFKRLGLSKFKTYINTIGCRKCRPEYISLLKEYLRVNLDNLCDDCKQRYEKNPLRVFDCKNEGCLSLLLYAPKITDNVCSECGEHFEGVKNYLRMLRVDFEVNKNLVRGFDYYEKTTFEVVSPLLGAQSAIGGGGRYDRLVMDCGGEDTPGLGFAIGVERLLLQLEEENVLPSADISVDVFVAAYKGFFDEAFEIMQSLRDIGIRSSCDYLKRSLKAQFKYADRLGARYVLIIAPEESEKGEVRVRNMNSGEEFTVKKEKLRNEIKKILSRE